MLGCGAIAGLRQGLRRLMELKVQLVGICALEFPVDEFAQLLAAFFEKALLFLVH